MRIGSLCSGYGGLDHAIQTVFPHATVVWHVEYDPTPSRVLHHHYPNTPNHGDVTTTDWGTVPPVNILTAGYPCQPFSLAGRRKGTNDARHLWPHILNAISALRPQAAFFENVRGHLTLGFDTVLRDLTRIGWDADWTTLRASEVGAPHHRERLFILAYPRGQRLQTQRLPSRPSKEVPSVANGLGVLAGVSDPTVFLHQCELMWGAAGARVANWALATGRPPPAPVTDQITYHDEDIWGRRFPESKPVLNPEFAEWMMGLPEGWVTNPKIGLTRSQQLHTIGNGVCPQQGAKALAQLLERSISNA